MQTKFESDTPTRHKGIKCGFSFLKFFSFCCAVTTTNDPSKAIFTVNIMIWEREEGINKLFIGRGSDRRLYLKILPSWKNEIN